MDTIPAHIVELVACDTLYVLADPATLGPTWSGAFYLAAAAAFISTAFGYMIGAARD